MPKRKSLKIISKKDTTRPKHIKIAPEGANCYLGLSLIVDYFRNFLAFLRLLFFSTYISR